MFICVVDIFLIFLFASVFPENLFQPNNKKAHIPMVQPNANEFYETHFSAGSSISRFRACLCECKRRTRTEEAKTVFNFFCWIKYNPKTQRKYENEDVRCLFKFMPIIKCSNGILFIYEKCKRKLLT